MIIHQEDRILFQGDSITDCGRDRSQSHSLGSGYVFMVAGFLSALQPGLKPEVLNRGISGNRSADLLNRWREDCLDLRPDVLSIMIGINDVWRRYDQNRQTAVEVFADNYRTVLARTRDAMPEIRLVILEPFVLPVPEDRRKWREDLDPKINVVRGLAREFQALYIPLDGIFAAACTRCDAAFWAADGVHPSPAGHGMIAKSWLQATGLLRE